MASVSNIPVVDLSAYGLGALDEEINRETIQSTADKICEAFRDIGFCYISNHGIPQSKVWPDIPEFQSTVEEFFKTCHMLSLKIFDLVSIGLHLEDDKCMRRSHDLIGQKGNSSAVRCLFYPSVPHNKVFKPNQVRCGEHSDYGSLTLLFQDDVGGLEVRNLSGEYVPATPIPGTILINIGDMMQRWTSDKLVATKHRVLIPEEETQKRKSRQSIAFFILPDDDVIIKSLDGSDKYEPISSFDYLHERLSRTY